jgi:acetolactate decarboxylase
MMHEQKTGPEVNLSNVLGPGSYALGALSELRGEVTILDGKVWLAYPGEADATRVEATTSSGETAALLVAAKVSIWKDVRIPEDTAWADLEKRVETLAKNAGVNVEEPFPILVEGELSDLRWHVIDGRKATPGPSSHQQHMQMAAKGRAANVRAVLLGFFSKQHQGIFTHHGENIHLHVVDAERRVTGHVDAVSLKQGAVLRVPG